VRLGIRRARYDAKHLKHYYETIIVYRSAGRPDNVILMSMPRLTLASDMDVDLP
jgi:hypothetical protein